MTNPAEVIPVVEVSVDVTPVPVVEVAIDRYGLTGPAGADSIVPGPQGEIGPQGDTGPQGEDGPQGLQGETGLSGESGPAGPQGPQGNIGADGAEGPAGAIGPTGPIGPTAEPRVIFETETMKVFFGPTAPISGMSEGDVWIPSV